MEQPDHLRRERQQRIRAIVRQSVLKGHALGQPTLRHIPEDDIPDPPLEEFEQGLDALLAEAHRAARRP